MIEPVFMQQGLFLRTLLPELVTSTAVCQAERPLPVKTRHLSAAVPEPVCRRYQPTHHGDRVAAPACNHRSIVTNART